MTTDRLRLPLHEEETIHPGSAKRPFYKIEEERDGQRNASDRQKSVRGQREVSDGKDHRALRCDDQEQSDKQDD